MNKILEQSLLYDFYGELLTEHQKEIYEAVVLNDFSLREVADEAGISRQGVHDLVRRCDRILANYEEKLHLVERFVTAKQLVSEIRTCLADYARTGDDSNLHQIDAISQKILEEL